jgi:hypothetical protein
MKTDERKLKTAAQWLVAVLPVLVVCMYLLAGPKLPCRSMDGGAAVAPGNSIQQEEPAWSGDTIAMSPGGYRR